MSEDILKIVVSAIVSAAVTGAIAYITMAKKTIKALKNGLLSLLRAEVIRGHDKYCKRGHCPLYAKEAIEKAYKAYHELGGNGAMTKLYEEILELPIE